MDKHCFIIVTEQFKANNEGYKSGCNTLVTATTTDGRIVVSANALNEFPELFEGRSRVDIILIGLEDFDRPTITL